MSGLSLLDTNVILRVILHEYAHPKYRDCELHAQIGGLICDYVMPEIVYQFLYNVKRVHAFNFAKEHDEVITFQSSPREYVAHYNPMPGWRCKAYKSFRVEIVNLLKKYTHIEIERKPLFDMALQIAIETGYDWVDCMLIAEHRVNGTDIASIDKDVLSGLAIGTYRVSSSEVNKLTL